VISWGGGTRGDWGAFAPTLPAYMLKKALIHTKFAFSRPEIFSLNMLLDFRPSSERRARLGTRFMQVIEACDKSHVPIKVRCDVFFLNISTIYKLQLYISSCEQYNNTKYIKSSPYEQYNNTKYIKIILPI
jgi:hypothetical protein